MGSNGKVESGEGRSVFVIRKREEDYLVLTETKSVIFCGTAEILSAALRSKGITEAQIAGAIETLDHNGKAEIATTSPGIQG
jgi:hypothetical protein